MRKSMEKIKIKTEEAEERKEIEERPPREEVEEEKMSEEEVEKEEAEIEARDEKELARAREKIKEMPEEGEGKETKSESEFMKEYRELAKSITELGIPDKIKEGKELTPEEQAKWERWKDMHEKKKESEFMKEYRELMKSIKESDIPKKIREGEELTPEEQAKWERFKVMFKEKKNAEKMAGALKEVLPDIITMAKSYREALRHLKEGLPRDFAEQYEKAVNEIIEAGIPEKLARGEELTLEEKLMIKHFKEDIEPTRRFLMGEPIEPTEKEGRTPEAKETVEPEKKEEVSEIRKEEKEEFTETKKEEEEEKEIPEVKKEEPKETGIQAEKKEEDFYQKLERTLDDYRRLKAQLEEVERRPKGLLGRLRGKKEEQRIREELWNKKKALERMRPEFINRESKKDYLLNQAKKIVEERYKKAGIKEPMRVLGKEEISRTATQIAIEKWEEMIK